MDSKNTPALKQSGGTRISRRTVTRGVAWSAPIAAVAYAAPAFAASQPVVVTPCGTACKHPGSGQSNKTYHFTFCFSTSAALVGGVVHLEDMRIVGNGNDNTRDVVPDTVAVAPGSPTCIYVDAIDFPNSANGQAILSFHYSTVDEPTVQIDGTVQTAALSLNPCDTGGDDGDNPQTYPHSPFGDDEHTPVNCVS
jgi:hypothetical protein